jgi:imidazolonepropionase-like amidohydrolase
MTDRFRVITLVLLLLVTAAAGTAQEQPVALVGARILPISGPEIAEGTLVVQRGKVLAVGPAGSVTLPEQTRRIDATGRVIMPGLVDTHSHIGDVSGADSSDPIQPEVRALDSINVRSAQIQKAQAGGITTVNVMPGSGHLLSGQTLYLKLRDGSTVEDLLIRRADGSIASGIKMANGTNSMRASGPPFPGTRARSAALIRQRYLEAQQFREKRERAAHSGESPPDRNLALEALVEVLEGTRTVHHHTHQHNDIMTVLRLADEFGYRPVLHHVSEGWKVADELAKRNIPSSIIVIDSPGGKLEARDLEMHTGATLERAGASVAFHTDDPVTDSRLFLRSPALAVRFGMSREGALRGVTLEAAKMLELDHRVGSLEPGKDADFIVLSGDPLSVYTKVLETWVDGVRVFDRSSPQGRLRAVGGWGAHHEFDPQMGGAQ